MNKYFLSITHAECLDFFNVPPFRSYLSGSPAKEGFTGKERDDETGFDYFGARIYRPDAPGFISVDPLASEFPNISSYAYGNNNPLKYTDPTGMAPEECPPCDFEYMTRFLFQNFDNTYIGDLFRADAQGQLDQKVSQDLKDAGNATVDAVGEFADKVSDASTLGAIGGVGLMAGGAAVTYFSGGMGTPLGAGMFETGLTMTGAAFTVGTAADAVSTAAKGIDMAAFDGSVDAFVYQAGELGVNALGARYLPRVGAATVRYLETATQATRRVPASFGLRTSVNVTTDATRVALPLLLFDQ